MLFNVIVCIIELIIPLIIIRYVVCSSYIIKLNLEVDLTDLSFMVTI
jgi:hypothetical protein